MTLLTLDVSHPKVASCSGDPLRGDYGTAVEARHFS
jgi:hypothetical protein